MQSEAYCKIHREYVIQYLILNNQSTHLACAACITELQDDNRKVTFDNILLLHEVQRNPQKIIKVLANIDQKFATLSYKCALISEEQVKGNFQQWENQMRQFQKWIDQLINEYKAQIAQVIQVNENTLKIYQKELKCDDLWDLIKQLQSQNGQTDIQDQIQIKIQKYFEDLQKNSDDVIYLINKQQENLSKGQQQKQDIHFLDEKEIEKKFESQLQQILDLNIFIRGQCNMNISKIIPFDYFQNLINQIESNIKQKVRKINQVYDGSKDGLNSNALWKQIEQRQNLLFIFKSKNPGNPIFGGYANCKFIGSLNGYSTDETVSSFIFSYTNNEIFPLKYEFKQNAVWCQQSAYAVYFGSNGDINISTDFNNGSSYLGNSYSWNQYQENAGAFLYGGDKPNIKECEVYEIIK